MFGFQAGFVVVLVARSVRKKYVVGLMPEGVWRRVLTLIGVAHFDFYFSFLDNDGSVSNLLFSSIFQY